MSEPDVHARILKTLNEIQSNVPTTGFIVLWLGAVPAMFAVALLLLWSFA